mgnify:CR=1 FL=1
MKEWEENSNNDYDLNNDDNSSLNDQSSLKGRSLNFKRNMTYQNEDNNFTNYNSIKNKRNKLSFLEDYPEQNNDDLYGLNDDSHFYRYPLTDEQKEYLMPKNSTLISKILDFFFNW